ncbi:MAG TPA: class I SAM-dependent methyltransferase [Chitinophagaceae bacterium]|nr:class I SAM-dependent methyltransferase [Chitinophagaceae bacterium]
MSTVEQNIKRWKENYKWTDAGEEWSSEWGGSSTQWFGTILPRIYPFLPTGTILEIAPGYGRWTNYLKNYCEQLMIVDVAENCIEACRHRFAAESKITCHVNDGKSLAMVPDNSVDFVFSFDSLVHAESDVIEAYLNQLAKKLKPTGFGFIHHSNIGSYPGHFSIAKRFPHSVTKRLTRLGILDTPHWRASSMTALSFERYCDRAGLQCVSQELVNWASKRLIDCLSVFTPKANGHQRSNVVIENPDFMTEAKKLRRLSNALGHG